MIDDLLLLLSVFAPFYPDCYYCYYYHHCRQQCCQHAAAPPSPPPRPPPHTKDSAAMHVEAPSPSVTEKIVLPNRQVLIESTLARDWMPCCYHFWCGCVCCCRHVTNNWRRQNQRTITRFCRLYFSSFLGAF